ncbi:anti-sigma factor [Leptolyngbya sp. NIES-2104]|uniref:anti-sigma factor n=1 Tax=Leptolyngbya sp. NIES-2104 TaxID=1552121 RepID=UPI0006EC46D2|nr:anti-sigma factor [Leptolyngbya sp. NIES-2104]GAP96944.1 hypothetical protein NIES2104_34910 [Leptolyngbya sp. NIES-2104]
MNHEERCFCELAPLYVLALLDEAERAWVEQQAAASPELAAELAELQATVGAISYSAPLVPVPTNLKDRLFERLNQSSSIPDESLSEVRQNSAERERTAQRRNRWRSRWTQKTARQAVLGAAAIGVVILGIDHYRLRQTAQVNQNIVKTLQQPNTRFYTLRGTDKAANASGSVVINSSQNALVVSIQNLPDLPAGQAYRLWAIPQGSTQPALCGQFRSDEAATGQWSRLQADCGTPATQLLMTAESVVAPPIPAGPLVMKSLL